MITNPETRTNIVDIAEGIYRINTPVSLPDGQRFSFNQYLVVDDEPLLFHTGPRALFPLVHDAVAAVMPVQRLRYVGLSHFEADECGSMNQWLERAPRAVPLASRIAAMVSVNDMADREAKAMADGETLSLGKHRLHWIDTPHVPHGWDAGMMFDETTATMFSGDLFTQPGPGTLALTRDDILGPSESFRRPMDYFAHAPQTQDTLARLAAMKPRTLACMHGSAWQGNGSALLLQLAAALRTREPASSAA